MFQRFMKSNGIKHVLSAPYHPATNGLAECFVQTMKQLSSQDFEERWKCNAKSTDGAVSTELQKCKA